MDWKYKHFNREATFNAPVDRVLDAVGKLKAESFTDWSTGDTPDGFVARGYSAFHSAVATFRVQPATSGTKVSVELLVERASNWGFMLFDVGGYYGRHMQKWLSTIGEQLGEPLPAAGSKAGRGCASGCFVTFVFGVMLTLISIPLDQIFFAQSSAASPGPIEIAAAFIALLAGLAAFAYVGYVDDSVFTALTRRVSRAGNRRQ